MDSWKQILHNRKLKCTQYNDPPINSEPLKETNLFEWGIL